MSMRLKKAKTGTVSSPADQTIAFREERVNYSDRKIG